MLAIPNVALRLIFSLCIALALNSRIRFRAFYRTIFFMPVLTMPVATATIWKWLFDPGFGPINATLGPVGLPQPEWLNHPETAVIAVVIVLLWSGVGYDMVIFLAGLQNIPREYYEAAQIDGASPFRQFRDITLPLLTPTTFFSDGDRHHRLAAGLRPGLHHGARRNANRFPTIVYYIYQEGFQNFRMGYAITVAWVLLLIILVFTLCSSGCNGGGCITHEQSQPRYTLSRVLLHVALLTIGIIFLLPFVWSISTSLKPMKDLFQVTPNLIPSEMRWQNYQRRPRQRAVPALLRQHHHRHRRREWSGRSSSPRWRLRLLAPALPRARRPLLPPPRRADGPRSGADHPQLRLMRQVGWLDSYQGLIVPLLFSAFGTFLIRQYLLSIPADYQEAATIEGANPFQIYWQIYLPLARPALVAFAFLVMLWSWNEFLWALIMTSQTEMRVLSVGIALLQGQHFSNNAF